MLSLPQLEDVCLLYGGHKQCRFLDGDDNDYTKFYCKKKSAEAASINQDVDEFIAEAKKNGDDPRDYGQALGDNCSGYVKLNDVLQGYDVDE